MIVVLLFLVGTVLGWMAGLGIEHRVDPPLVQSQAGSALQDPLRPTHKDFRNAPGTWQVATWPDTEPAIFPKPREKPALLAGRPELAIVVDDLGLSRQRSITAIRLPKAITLAFLSYGRGLSDITENAIAAGHEILVHVPMQPKDRTWDAGENVLRSDFPEAELRRRLDWALSRFDGYVGINNHMGSAFTENRKAMTTVLEELKGRGLIFLDSQTTPDSKGETLAREMALRYAERDVFLDNVKQAAVIRENLNKAADIARQSGQAVAIGHPYKVTLDVLADWVPKAAQRGIAVVPLSAVSRIPASAAPRTVSVGSQ